jgi:DNA-binding response OmpR family regulator
LSRDELLQDVWGYKGAPLTRTRTVDVHIAWLRQKIEDDAKNPRFIVTVHGEGYRFTR